MQGLPWLLEAYPKAQLAFHEKEAPFIIGGHQYKELQGDTIIFELGKYTQGVDSRQPQQRAVLLKVGPPPAGLCVSGNLITSLHLIVMEQLTQSDALHFADDSCLALASWPC